MPLKILAVARCCSPSADWPRHKTDPPGGVRCSTVVIGLVVGVFDSVVAVGYVVVVDVFIIAVVVFIVFVVVVLVLAVDKVAVSVNCVVEYVVVVDGSDSIPEVAVVFEVNDVAGDVIGRSTAGHTSCGSTTLWKHVK